jgi:tetratricopeptide (TPR) repeat protein
MDLPEEERIILLAVLAVFMILVIYFEMRVMRGKSKDARKMSVRKDEAFNSILTCRSVINVLERQGSDVSEARALVDKAKSHMQRGEHEIAIDLCEKARNELTKVRSKSTRTLKAPASEVERDSFELVAEDIVSAPRSRLAEDSYSGSKLEVQGGPNYLVAKFELNTAREEVARASDSGRDVSGASQTLVKAQAEFDAGNYQKALSLAVKAKKAASPQGAEEMIQLRKTQAQECPSEAVDGEASDVVDVCSSCGSEIDPEDVFCGACGKSREKERVCPSCSRTATRDDRFCRKCGTKVP